jgi:D-alanyl-D-alanine carboxypeptidase (penicillin-binding protein 5/6)
MRARVSYAGPLVAPLPAGAEVGRLRIYRGDILVTEMPAVTAEAVARGTLVQRARDAAGALSVQVFRRLRGS